MKRKNLLQRITMPLPELEIYYREQRKCRFEQGKRLKHIRLRETLYPLVVWFVVLDRIFRKQTIAVMGDYKKYKEQVIYACTYIGENDVQSIFEVIRRGCWWFVGAPGVLYKDISGLLLYLNGCIMLETGNKEDRHIAYLRALELLKAGGSLMIYPEGARNGTENLPVMPLFQGTAKMAMETNTKIVPVAIEQYGDHFIINFGTELLPGDFDDNFALTQKLRDSLVTLKWEIWERDEVQSRKSLPDNYRELFIREFEIRIHPYDTLETVERTRFHTKAEIEQKEVFEHLNKLIPCRENAFLFRENGRWLYNTKIEDNRGNYWRS